MTIHATLQACLTRERHIPDFRAILLDFTRDSVQIRSRWSRPPDNPPANLASIHTHRHTVTFLVVQRERYH
jgi:hypothetical protein